MLIFDFLILVGLFVLRFEQLQPIYYRDLIFWRTFCSFDSSKENFHKHFIPQHFQPGIHVPTDPSYAPLEQLDFLLFPHASKLNRHLVILNLDLAPGL